MITNPSLSKHCEIDASRFSAVDAWCDVSGWESLVLRQIEPGKPEVAIEAYTGKRTQLHRIQLNRGCHQRGGAPGEYSHFAIPCNEGRLVWRGRDVTAGCLLNHNDPQGFDAVSDTGFSAFVISVRQEVLQDMAQALELDITPQSLTASDAIYSVRNSQVPRLRHRLEQFFNAMERYPVSQGSVSAVEEIESNLPGQLLYALADPVESGGQPSARIRGGGLERSLAYIEQNAREAITVQELCKAAAVNWRTLERAYRDHFGMTPKAYLKSVRLNGVRGELLQAVPDEKIIEIAGRWGFWHPGQFAADYRKLFGELPTATRSAY